MFHCGSIYHEKKMLNKGRVLSRIRSTYNIIENNEIFCVYASSYGCRLGRTV